MVQFGRKRTALITLACVFAFISGWKCVSQSVHNDTFTITISLHALTIPAGEIPVIEEITENKTNHLVYAGWGEGGPLVELINSKGEDISLHVLGNERNDSDNYLRPVAKRLEPGYHNRGLWPVHMEQGYLAPGVYKLRIHRLDIKDGDTKSRAEVYSNTVTFTVVP
jgi:hypothetical protein